MKRDLTTDLLCDCGGALGLMRLKVLSSLSGSDFAPRPAPAGVRGTDNGEKHLANMWTDSAWGVRATADVVGRLKRFT